MEALMKPCKHIVLIAVVAITILSLLLSACGPIDNSNGNSNKNKDQDKGQDSKNDTDESENTSAGKVTICHRTGSAKNPYVEITVSVNATSDGHGTHAGDLIPAPQGGCPATVADTADNDNNADNDEGGNADKITICHKTGSAKHPYVEITVSVDATTDGHGTHEGDLIPAPETGCPSSVITTDPPAR